MRVLIVDDSMLIRSMLRALLESFEYEIAGEEGNGKKGVEAARRLRPDLILMDINMPVMDGITATGIIMKENPVPIVIFTSEDIAEVGWTALTQGAVEIIPKPDIHQMNDKDFKLKLKTILDHAVKFKTPESNSNEGMEGLKQSPFTEPRTTGNLVVIGASTGGPSAVKTVLEALPEDFPIPIIITQHIEEGFDVGYAEWLNESAKLHVRIASSHDKIAAGEVIVAAATHHLICRKESLFWDDGPRLDNQKPSVDKMFTSAAESFGSGITGVLLTGMGMDGAKGCLEILKKGGTTIIQNKESSMIFGMPKAAIELGAASKILPLTEIAAELIARFM